MLYQSSQSTIFRLKVCTSSRSRGRLSMMKSSEIVRLNRSMKAFSFGERTWGIEVRETEQGAGFLEEEGEFAPIVRLKLIDDERTDLDDSSEEVGCSSRRV